MDLNTEMRFPYNDASCFTGLPHMLINQYQRMNNGWADKVERMENLIKAITRDGKLVPYHFQCWADQIEEEQRYKSNLSTWLREVAEATEGLDA